MENVMYLCKKKYLLFYLVMSREAMQYKNDISCKFPLCYFFISNFQLHKMSYTIKKMCRWVYFFIKI